MATLAELIVEQVQAGRTVEFSGQPGAFPGMVHVSVTDANEVTFGRGDCVAHPSELHELVHQAVAELGGA